MIDITLDGTTNYQPGDTIRGELSWALTIDVSQLALRLVWNTSGRATEYVQVASEQLLGAQPRAGRHPFELTAPQTPYSCDGKLVSIQWAVEAVVNDGAESARASFISSPTGQTLILAAVTDTSEPAHPGV
ncbi:MAG TPA: hypothetical protein PKB10_13615 [Tepidisphaeraceae bacterium]|nr:hypothetical protein [Tepidisphaeraceae bacterium]